MKQPSIQLTGNTTTTTAEEALYQARPEDSSEHEISLQAQRGLPLILPWGTKPVRLGTTFHSSLLSAADPWSDETPFVLSDLLIIPKELHFEAGTDSTFKKVSTSKQSETEDHLSLKFGVGVGIPFLAEASVEGTYEKHVQENRDADKISLNATCRAGTIELMRQPRLTREAIIEIKYGDGLEGLCDRFGDYYLAGYRLGGKTGILLSANSHKRNQTESYNVTATVSALGLSYSDNWEDDVRSFCQGRSVKLLGYDTLDNKTWKKTSGSTNDVRELIAWEAYDPKIDAETLRATAENILIRSENLIERINDVLGKYGHRSGCHLTFTQCEQLMKEGIVVELLLEPLSGLRDVISWLANSDII